MGWESSGVVGFDLGPLLQGQTRIAKAKSAYNLLIMSTPLGGGHIIFAFSGVRCPASHLVSRHFRQQFLSYLYQIWHAGLLG